MKAVLASSLLLVPDPNLSRLSLSRRAGDVGCICFIGWVEEVIWVLSIAHLGPIRAPLPIRTPKSATSGLCLDIGAGRIDPVRFARGIVGAGGRQIDGDESERTSHVAGIVLERDTQCDEAFVLCALSSSGTSHRGQGGSFRAIASSATKS